jgi:nitroreductase
MILPAGFFERIARAGAWAPSGDNLQPWSFAVDKGTLVVMHDRRRDRSLFNVRHLASYIALGAVLENVSIAASKERYRANIAYFPDAQEPDLIARVSFENGAGADRLADAIEKRCTNRRPYANNRALDGIVIQELDRAISYLPDIGLHWLHEPGDLKSLGNIVARADRLLFENRLIHSHLFSTLRWNIEEVERTRDGLPIETLELGALGSKAFRALRSWSLVQMINRFGFSAITASQSAMLMRRCSAAGLITAPDISPLSFVKVGHAFQRIWLHATNEKLALQPMTAVVFLQLRAILGDHQGLASDQITTADLLRIDLAKVYAVPPERVPAMHFRIGYAPAPSGRTIRRQSSEGLSKTTQ